MLRHLTIRDFVLFDELEVEIGDGLTVISGETGGGKSNLTSALSLLSGGRARRDQVRKGRDFAEIRATFLTGGRTIEVCRVVPARGQGRSTIDGETVNLTTLRNRVGPLLSITGQHEQISLADPDAHRSILDEAGNISSSLASYSQCWDSCQKLRAELRKLQEAEKDREYRKEWLQHQIREIRAIDPEPDEDETIDREIRLLANHEKVSHALGSVNDRLYEAQGSASELVSAAIRDLEDVADFLPRPREHLDTLEDARSMIDEVAREVASHLDSMDADPGVLEAKQERAYALQNLKKKHGPSLGDVIESLARMETEITSLDDLEASIRTVTDSLQSETVRAVKLATDLSRSRKRAASRFGKKVTTQLADLAFTSVEFRVQVTRRPVSESPLDALDQYGLDEVSFLFRPNVGEDLLPLQDIASGGELSRVFLAIRATLRGADRDRVLVFDEADTGIGGKVADALGYKLHGISRDRQAICVTHLAQIAAYADTHILVEKARKGDRTTSRAQRLDPPQRTDEVARMLGGASVTKKGKEAAEEMIRLAAKRMRTSA